MSGYTENRIVIYRDYDFVFDLTNNISHWPVLFTEYQAAEVLEKKNNYVKFQLTTHPTDHAPSKSWTSERHMDKKNKRATAERLDPKFPFEYMNIRWEYDVIENATAVVMTWIQEFNVHPECKFSVEQMESYLNRNTRVQMKSVKEQVEQWDERQSPVSL